MLFVFAVSYRHRKTAHRESGDWEPTAETAKGISATAATTFATPACVTNVHDMQGYDGLRREGFLFPVQLEVKSYLAVVDIRIREAKH